MTGFSPYHRAADSERLIEDHPIGPAFEKFALEISRDALFARQDRLFRRCVARAWQTGFYRRLWGEAGIEPGDIRGLEDLPRLPVFDKSDLMRSIEAYPPFGDFGGFERGDPARPPVVFHTTSGTTGRPQTLLFGPKSREVQNLLLARAYRWQGLSADDVVHSCYGHGTVNGGHYVREAVLHWTNALFVSAGTGLETPSARQVGLMRDFGATVLVGFADYLKRLAEVAAAEGLVIGEDPRGRIDGRLHGMLPQNPEAEGVDGADDGLIDLRPVMAQLLPRQHLPAHALPHLGGRGVGEGDCRHLGDAVIREQGDVALHEDTGLAAAGAGRDQHVAAPLGSDRGLLRCHFHFHRLNSFTRQTWRKEQ